MNMIANKKRFFLRRIKRAPRNLFVVSKYLLSMLYNKYNVKVDIEELRNKHSGETIYIVGTGPSLSTYPDDFMIDKISMTLHLAFLKFPDTTYAFFTEADRLRWLVENHSEIFKTKIICSNPLFPLVRPSTICKDFFQKIPVQILYSPFQLHFDKIELMINSAKNGIKIRYQSNQSVLHNAIWASIILGFIELRLIGCDQKQIQGEHYFKTGDPSADLRQSAPDRVRTKEFFENIYNIQNIYLKEIIKLAQKYGIKMKWFADFKSARENKTTLLD